MIVSNPVHPTQFKPVEPRLVQTNFLEWKKKHQNVGTTRDPNHPKHTTSFDVGDHLFSGLSKKIGAIVDDHLVHPLERLNNRHDVHSNQRDSERIHKLPYSRTLIPQSPNHSPLPPSQINGNNGSATNTDDHGKGKVRSKGMKNLAHSIKAEAKAINRVARVSKKKIKQKSRKHGGNKGPKPIHDIANINKSVSMKTPVRKPLRFKMREKIMDITGIVGFTNNSFYLNPGNIKLHPMMSGVFAHWQTYKYLRLAIEFVTSTNVATGNQINAPDIIAVTNRDCTIAPFVDITSAEQYGGTIKSLAYSNLQHNALGAVKMNPSDKLFVNYANNQPVNNTQSSAQLTNIGLFQFITGNVASTYAGFKLGELYVDYEVELSMVHATMNTPATLCTQIQGGASSSSSFTAIQIYNNMTGITATTTSNQLSLNFPVGVGGNFYLNAQLAASANVAGNWAITNPFTNIFGFPNSAGQNTMTLTSAFTATSALVGDKFYVNPAISQTLILSLPGGTYTGAFFNVDLCQMSGPMGASTSGGSIVVGPQIISEADLEEKIDPLLKRLAELERRLNFDDEKLYVNPNNNALNHTLPGHSNFFIPGRLELRGKDDSVLPPLSSTEKEYECDAPSPDETSLSQAIRDAYMKAKPVYTPLIGSNQPLYKK